MESEQTGAPLDFNKLKDFVRQESLRHNLPTAKSKEIESLFTLSLALSAAVKKVFYEKSELTFSKEPEISRKLVTQFVNRMRIDGMEKFNSTTVVSVVFYAMNEDALNKKKYAGTIIVYTEQKFLPELLRMMKYPYIDNDDENEVKDGCGTLANLIAGQYKKEMQTLGYKDLTMSPFYSYINSTPDGIEIPQNSLEKYEISFLIDGEKRLVVEIVMPNAPGER